MIQAASQVDWNGVALATSIADSPHRDIFAARGLTDDTIRGAGIQSLSDRAEIAARLGRKNAPLAWGACIAIPYGDDTGAVVFHRLRPNNPPRSVKTGKPQKYLQPSGVKPRLYVPATVWPTLRDPVARLIITEGEFKALAATQNGFPTVALPGVDCWHDKGKVTLSTDLARWNWKGREVFIAFDSDAAENEHVSRNERQLAAVLQSYGASVKIIRLPSGPAGTDGKPVKLGLDDYLVAHGPSEFWKLLQGADDPTPPDAGELRENATEADPAIEAEHIRATCTLGNGQRLHFWNGDFYWWNQGRHAPKPLDEVRGQVINAMNARWTFVRSRHASDVIDHLKAKSLLASSIEAPTWLEKPPHDWPADECLATMNAVVHLPSLIKRVEPYQVASTPAFWNTTATEFGLDADAPRPSAWLTFLESLWGDDPQSIEALQEWFGYLLVHDTRQQKMLLLVGPKRSGKGTIARVLTALVGKDNVAAPTLGGLATNFGLWPLIGKSVGIIPDARLSGRSDQAAVVERLLSITGEDSITVDRKNMQPITLRLPTRFVILTNELPKLSDASGAIVSRVILLHTNRSFYGREDHDLSDKLLTELPGILLWAIEGWRRLRARGRLLQPETGLESLGDMNDLASPVAAFIRERCEVSRLARVTTADLFSAWTRWCESQGREKLVGTVQTFARDLLAAELSIARVRLRDGEERQRAYEGIELKEGW
jgi:putative DNA primase/helicase